MPLLKFRVTWDEDDNVCRDIEIMSNQSFMDFHLAIQKHFALKVEWSASFYVISESGKRTHELNTEVEKNIKGAPALSCSRSPIGALVSSANQEFIYALFNQQEWDFRINLLTIERDGARGVTYPVLVRAEGLSPMELSAKGKGGKESIVETEERYDLGGGNDDEEGAEGFGFDDEQGSDSLELGGGTESEDF